MIKKTLIAVAATALLTTGLAAHTFADAGPAEITLQATDSKKPKPAVFPHKAHQETLPCAECHHGMEDGKQTPFVEGMTIGKCQSCHNEDVLGGRKKDKLKLDTFKGAGHGNCLECHKTIASEDVAKKDLKKCSTCHPKK